MTSKQEKYTKINKYSNFSTMYKVILVYSNVKNECMKSISYGSALVQEFFFNFDNLKYILDLNL